MAWLQRSISLVCRPHVRHVLGQAHCSVHAPFRHAMFNSWTGSNNAALASFQKHAVHPFGMSQRLYSTSVGPIKILFGSQTGTAHGFAEQLCDDMLEKKLDAEVFDMYDYNPSDLAKEKDICVFVASCYGRGEPTDSAKSLFKWLNDEARTPEEFKALKYTIFGLGSSKTHEAYYNVVGRKMDKRLEELGATRIYVKGEGDDSGSIETDFEEWEQGLLEALQKGDMVSGEEATGQDEKDEMSPTGHTLHIHWDTPHVDPSVLRREKTHTVKVKSNKELTPKSARSAKELTLDLTGTPLKYETGDHVGIFPVNNINAVIQAEEALFPGIDPNHKFTFRASPNQPEQGPTTLRSLLTHNIDLEGVVTPRVIRAMAACAESGSEKAALLELASKERYPGEVKGACKRVVDMVSEEFTSVDMPLERFIEVMPRLLPRYYSISSCSTNHPKDIHITYRHLCYTLPGGYERHGVCSSHLASCQPGSKLNAFVRTSEFRLPSDPAAPIIMVGGGSGIAPMKAFVEQRTLYKENGIELGPAALFYGCNEKDDFIYREEIETALRDGVLSHVYPAYSQVDPDGNTMLVTEKLLEQSKHVWEMISSHPESSAYVCGGATGFGAAVVQSFKNTAKLHGKTSLGKEMQDEDADKFFFDLIECGRYMEDLSD